MRPENSDPTPFTFRYFFQGLFWMALGGCMSTMIIFVGGMTIWNFISIRFYSLGDAVEMIREILIMLPSSIIYSLLIAFVLVLPVMLLPFASATALLIGWLQRDRRANHLSRELAQIRGILVGGLAGIATILLRTKIFPVWPMVWTYVFRDEALQIIFWTIIYTLPITGAITSRHFGKTLTDQLNKT